MPHPEAMAVPVQPLAPSRLEPFVGRDRVAELERAAARLRDRLGERRVVNANSTAVGGGVAEMLQTLLGYARGLGIRAEWLVIEGDPEFFEITKRIHNGLYGGPGDGGELGEAERVPYERTLSTNAPGIERAVRRGDVVLVHDPQPAGLVPVLLEAGALVIWRCHVGLDETNAWAERAWRFVRPYVEDAHGFVFSRRRFAPPGRRGRLAVIHPRSVRSPEEQALDREDVLGVLAAAALSHRTAAGHPASRRARVVREGGAPQPTRRSSSRSPAGTG
jgi:trehalose synthase